ncbi:hypothetical protein H8B06_04970 [Sphingobacterium sp. DN00404]|uniref:DUF4625 domain-containing protein n=1 Tax=Sphingobacterium micropteri TaxID=2763501 RepID=A0ABR7YLH6_9SPHI|nr:hypothetical protein [Sphingobacterium micropteri]MBD1432170.1 hypothetical protein [Sphingobacterium micropteri]
MKQINIFILAISILFFAPSCSKDDPIPEEDQEEVGTATLTFTEVEREAHGDHYHYNDITDPEIEEVKFEGKDMLPPVDAHLHLEVGKTYRLELLATDFAGRETQQTFVSRADIHQAFILGAEAGSLEYVYADRNADNQRVNVGVTGYLTVLQETNTFTLRYVMRHLNPGVKDNITAADWNNTNFTQFTGANDLDLKVAVHLVSEDGHHH